MKKRILIILLLLCSVFSSYLFAQERPQAQITFRVVTDDGKPVTSATVGMSTFHHWQPGEGFGKDISETFTGVTNEKGMVTISGSSLRGDFGYGVRDLPGFYGGSGGNYHFTAKANGKWQPWNPVVDIVAKPILNPIPMYARRIGGVIFPPELGQSRVEVRPRERHNRSTHEATTSYRRTDHPDP